MYHNKKRQQGVVLILSLIILFAMTLITISGMQSTLLEGDMARNIQDKGLSYQASESALIDGELVIANYTTEPKEVITTQIPAGTVSGQVWARNSPIANPTDYSGSLPRAAWPKSSQANYQWWMTHGTPVTTPLSTANIATQPRYIIEFLDRKMDNLNVGKKSDSAGINFYKITSWGIGAQDEVAAVTGQSARPATASVHQTTYAKRF